MKKIKYKNYTNTTFLTLLAIFFVITLHFYFYNYSFIPLTEGWFNVFASQVIDGKVVYRDFNFYLTPLYLHFFSIFISIFDDNIFTLRTLGLFINFGIIFLIYINFKFFFNAPSSFLIAIASYFYYQSGVAFISYDFTQFLTLTSLACLYSMNRMIVSLFKKDKSFLLWTFFTGFFSCAAFMIKQSNGSFIFLSILISISIISIYVCKVDNKNSLYKFYLSYFVGVGIILLPYFIYFLINSAFINFLSSIFSSAISAKGNLNSIIYSWLINTLFNKIFWVQVFEILRLLFFLLLFIVFLKTIVIRSTNKFQTSNFYLSRDYFFICFYFFLIISLLILIYLNIFNLSIFINNIIFYFNYVIPLTLTFSLMGLLYSITQLFFLKNYNFLIYLCFFIFSFGLFFANGTSAGLSEISSYLILGFILGLMSKKVPYVGSIFMLFLSLSIILFFSFKKYEQPYNWWGITQGDVRLSRYESNINLFKNINLSSDSKKSYDQIKIYIEKFSHKNIYSYPSIPIIYRIANRYPDSKTIVQWYDFLPDNEARLEALRLKDNPPDIIFYLSLPDLVIDTHEKLFRNNTQSGQRDIVNLISNLIDNKVYSEIDEIKLSDNVFIKIFKKQN